MVFCQDLLEVMELMRAYLTTNSLPASSAHQLNQSLDGLCALLAPISLDATTATTTIDDTAPTPAPTPDPIPCAEPIFTAQPVSSSASPTPDPASTSPSSLGTGDIRVSQRTTPSQIDAILEQFERTCSLIGDEQQ